MHRLLPGDPGWVPYDEALGSVYLCMRACGSSEIVQRDYAQWQERNPGHPAASDLRRSHPWPELRRAASRIVRRARADMPPNANPFSRRRPPHLIERDSNIAWRYGAGDRLQDIADDWGITPARVNQVAKRQGMSSRFPSHRPSTRPDPVQQFHRWLRALHWGRCPICNKWFASTAARRVTCSRLCQVAWRYNQHWWQPTNREQARLRLARSIAGDPAKHAADSTSARWAARVLKEYERDGLRSRPVPFVRRHSKAFRALVAALGGEEQTFQRLRDLGYVFGTTAT